MSRRMSTCSSVTVGMYSKSTQRFDFPRAARSIPKTTTEGMCIPLPGIYWKKLKEKGERLLLAHAVHSLG